ncbi:MAG: metal ABC transporter permease [Anaerolineae bacterium]|jgi:manganese/zinc/iron transport system permease protein|nr:metal ABC transporter permease [Anaerolineae bacterium]
MSELFNALMSDPRTVAVLVGALVAISGAVLGTFLFLRQMSMTTDAISHTILLGIVVAFLVMTAVFGLEPDLSSPWLILGAAAAGLGTVLLTEAIQRTGLVKADAALGLAFPFLFALSILLVSRYTEDVHLDIDSVTVGEIGLAWANTHSVCLAACDSVTITPDHPSATTERVCVNCASDGLSPRSPQAVFETRCANCGTYTAAQAHAQGLTDSAPSLLFVPKSLVSMGVITLINLLFVGVLYKELKLATFDSLLARALGFRPAALHYALMMLVSLTAVGAFDAVGSILVVAFFVIPPATAHLLTRRLSRMVVIAAGVGALAAWLGYDLARGQVFGLIDLDALTGGAWDVSISASMVVMMFVLFVLAWVFAPRRGLLARTAQRWLDRRKTHESPIAKSGEMRHNLSQNR